MKTIKNVKRRKTNELHSAPVQGHKLNLPEDKPLWELSSTANSNEQHKTSCIYTQVKTTVCDRTGNTSQVQNGYITSCLITRQGEFISVLDIIHPTYNYQCWQQKTKACLVNSQHDLPKGNRCLPLLQKDNKTYTILNNVILTITWSDLPCYLNRNK